MNPKPAASIGRSTKLHGGGRPPGRLQVFAKGWGVQRPVCVQRLVCAKRWGCAKGWPFWFLQQGGSFSRENLRFWVSPQVPGASPRQVRMCLPPSEQRQSLVGTCYNDSESPHPLSAPVTSTPAHGLLWRSDSEEQPSQAARAVLGRGGRPEGS